jgi:biotin carboxyl carrier protein
MKYIATLGDQEYTIEIIDDNRIMVDGVLYEMDFESISGQPVFSLLIEGKNHEAYVFPDDTQWEVLLRGILYPVVVEDEREKRLRSSFGGGPSSSEEFYLKAPMPGLVISVPAEEGMEVKQGDVLLILESMKMQNELKSPKKGIISRVRVEKGDHVERKQTLLSVV